MPAIFFKTLLLLHVFPQKFTRRKISTTFRGLWGFFLADVNKYATDFLTYFQFLPLHGLQWEFTQKKLLMFSIAFFQVIFQQIWSFWSLIDFYHLQLQHWFQLNFMEKFSFNPYYTLFQLQTGNMVWYTLSGFYIPRAGGEGNIQSRQRISDNITFLDLK